MPADGAIYDSPAWFKTFRLGKILCQFRVTSSTLLDAHERHTKPVLVTGNHPFVGIQALALVPSELAKLTERAQACGLGPDNGIAGKDG